MKKVYLHLVSDYSWKVCTEQSNRVTDMSLNNRVYDSELVTMTILHFHDIHFMQKILYVCPNIYTHYPSKHCKRYCMYVQIYTLITLVNTRDNFHNVSKWIHCKSWNYIQCVDICIDHSLFQSGWYSSSYTVDFYVCMSTLLVSLYMFSVHIMLLIVNCCDIHVMVKP